MVDSPSPRWRFLEGFGIVWAILFAMILLVTAVFLTWADWGPNGPTNGWTNIPIYAIMFCGLTQLAYVIPSYLFLKKKDQPLVAKGVLWGALSVLAVNLLVYFLVIR
jgi:hypothetical protein